MKTGWKTTEFWLTLLSLVATAVASGGLFAATSPWQKIALAVVAGLSAAGYSVSRGIVKRGQS